MVAAKALLLPWYWKGCGTFMVEIIASDAVGGDFFFLPNVRDQLRRTAGAAGASKEDVE
jgi:hypothetical protein